MELNALAEQLQLESDAVEAGIERYTVNKKRLEDAGAGDKTRSSHILISDWVQELSLLIEEFKSQPRGVGSVIKKYIKGVDNSTLAYITMREVFSSLGKGNNKVARLTAAIGAAVMQELKYTEFQKAHPDYHKYIMRRFAEAKTRSVRHKNRSLSGSMRNVEFVFEEWTLPVQVNVGSLLLKLFSTLPLCEVKNITERNKTIKILVPTEDMLEWVMDFDNAASASQPVYPPMVAPPVDWDADTLDGGYYTEKMRDTCKMVIAGKQQLSEYSMFNMKPIAEGINIIQRTPWKINTRVLDTLIEVWNKNLGCGIPSSEQLTPDACPIDFKDEYTDEEQIIIRDWKKSAIDVYTQNKRRVSVAFTVTNAIRMANRFRNYPAIYFPHHADFRGRIYSVINGASPQGADYAKSLLLFAEGKPLATERGEFWFLLHGANRFGFDKLPFDERIRKIKELNDLVLRTASDPIGNISFWANADKPWGFLAWCFEYEGYVKEGLNFVSHIPIALDGTCNGLQHYAAMLRDPVAARAVNLAKHSAPADIYTDVANVVIRKLHSMPDDDMARKWLEVGITRKLCKPPVMTLPYGSTRYTCTDTAVEYVMDKHRDAFDKPREAGMFISKIIWDSIGEVVFSAREGMAFIRELAGTLAKDNINIRWVTPLGFPVIQDTPVYESRKVHTQIGQLVMKTRTAKVNPAHARNSAAPNFVHSLDSTHMLATVLTAYSKGVHSFAMIHDDYGVHACDTDILYTAIRETFVWLYSHDVLQMLLDDASKLTDKPLPAVPSMGNFDIHEVLTSEFFFS